MHPPLQCVLFDLDGTLLDTAPDLIGTLNELRHEHGLADASYEKLRPFVSRGARAIVKQGFGIDDHHPDLPALHKRFLAIYQTRLCTVTRFFDGTDAILQQLESHRIPWGIVTNKQQHLTHPLLEEIGLAKRAACVVCGDTLPQRKPDPEPILYACQLLHAHPANTAYIGDAANDIQAGTAANVRTVLASYGYVDAETEALAHKADGNILHPSELWQLLNQWFLIHE